MSRWRICAARPDARRLLLALALTALTACRPSPPPEPPVQHRCVEIPNGLVECTVVQPPASPAR